MSDSDPSAHELVGVWSRLSLHEFLVDFFGAMVPGILFICAIASVLLPALQALSAAVHEESTAVQSPWASVRDLLTVTKDTPGMIWIALFAFVLMVGYVVGQLFYRRDPKVPDQRSFARLKRKAKVPPNENVDEWLQKNFACKDEAECQFPYQYMNKYLAARGHDHLALIAEEWSGDERSKIHINRLKLRLAFWYPEKYRPVVLNEANVRLVTSTWYMADALWKLGLMVIALVLLPATLMHGHLPKVAFWEAVKWIFDASVPALIVIAAALYSRRACEAFVHYQRLREVFVVLELAYTADKRARILEAASPVRPDSEAPGDTVVRAPAA